MRTFFITLLITITTSLSLFAENIYILYSQDCMNKMEYDRKNEGKDFFAFQINTNQDEHIILEVDKEATQTLNSLPTPFIGCYNGKFDKKLVQTVNRNINNYFVVTRSGKKFEVHPINFASHYKKSGEWITYTSPKYSFRFNLIAGTIGENISQSKDAKVYFEGVLPEECYNAYLFRQFPSGQNKEFIDIKFVPEVGLINEQIGTTPGDDSKGNSTLVRVNKSRYSRYLSQLCGNPVKEESPMPMAYSDEQQKDVPKDWTAKGGNAMEETLPPPPAPEFHTVAKGETLYGIARKYNVSVNDIKKWNHKRTTNIKRGERLRISKTITSKPSTMTAKSGQVVWDKNKKKNSQAKVISRPVTKPTTHIPNSKNTGTYHTVRPGETVAYLAMKYGYTEARFRKMNHLKSTAPLKVNQRVIVNDCPCAEDEYSLSPSEFTSKSGSKTKVSTYKKGVSSTRKTPDAPAPYYHPEFTKKGGTAHTAKVNEDFDDEPMAYSTSTSGPEVKFNKTTEERSISDYYYPSPVGKKRTTYPTPESKKLQEKDLTPKGVTNEVINGSDGVNRKVHIVQEGETLYRIAKYYNMKVEDIRKLNHLERGEVLMPYQRLYVN